MSRQDPTRSRDRIAVGTRPRALLEPSLLEPPLFEHRPQSAAFRECAQQSGALTEDSMKQELGLVAGMQPAVADIERFARETLQALRMTAHR